MHHCLMGDGHPWIASYLFHLIFGELHFLPLAHRALRSQQCGPQPKNFGNSGVLQAQFRPKKNGLQRDVKFGRVGHLQRMMLNREIIPC